MSVFYTEFTREGGWSNQVLCTREGWVSNLSRVIQFIGSVRDICSLVSKFNCLVFRRTFVPERGSLIIKSPNKNNEQNFNCTLCSYTNGEIGAIFQVHWFSQTLAVITEIMFEHSVPQVFYSKLLSFLKKNNL